MPSSATICPGNRWYAFSSRTSTATRALLEVRREPSSKMAPRVSRPPPSGHTRPTTMIFACDATPTGVMSGNLPDAEMAASMSRMRCSNAIARSASGVSMNRYLA